MESKAEGDLRTDFLMVIIASGIARGRVRTTTTTTTTTMTTTTTTVEARNMVAMLWQEMHPPFAAEA